MRVFVARVLDECYRGYDVVDPETKQETHAFIPDDHAKVLFQGAKLLAELIDSSALEKRVAALEGRLVRAREPQEARAQ